MQFLFPAHVTNDESHIEMKNKRRKVMVASRIGSVIESALYIIAVIAYAVMATYFLTSNVFAG